MRWQLIPAFPVPLRDPSQAFDGFLETGYCGGGTYRWMDEAEQAVIQAGGSGKS